MTPFLFAKVLVENILAFYPKKFSTKDYDVDVRQNTFSTNKIGVSPLSSIQTRKTEDNFILKQGNAAMGICRHDKNGGE
jgi:hypothetical protein